MSTDVLGYKSINIKYGDDAFANFYDSLASMYGTDSVASIYRHTATQPETLNASLKPGTISITPQSPSENPIGKGAIDVTKDWFDKHKQDVIIVGAGLIVLAVGIVSIAT